MMRHVLVGFIFLFGCEFNLPPPEIRANLEVETAPEENVTGNSAIMGGRVKVIKRFYLEEAGVMWSKSRYPNEDVFDQKLFLQIKRDVEPSTEFNFSYTVNDLEPLTEYFFRAYAVYEATQGEQVYVFGQIRVLSTTP